MPNSKQESRKQETHNYEFVIVGHVINPCGTKGEIKVEVLTDFPDRFATGREVYINGYPMTIERSRPYKDRFILKLSNIDNIETASHFQGEKIEIPLSEIHNLAEGEYYRFQIMGLEVLDTQGEPVGKITNILPTGSNDVYIVTNSQGEFLIPATEEVIKSIDLKNNRMIIQAIEGLL